ncbi:MAG: hypothetical protein RR504_04015 [Christensenellaceae bacterium]
MLLDTIFVAIKDGQTRLMLGNFYAAGTAGTYTFKLQMVTVDNSEVVATTGDLSVTIPA